MQMEDFRMVSSRVGAEGGVALAKGLAAGGRHTVHAVHAAGRRVRMPGSAYWPCYFLSEASSSSCPLAAHSPLLLMRAPGGSC
jgi:hypothetical protein